MHKGAMHNGKRLLIFGAYASMGPVSGPLIAGAVRSWRSGHRILAGLYVVATVQMFFLLPILIVKINAFNHLHHG